MQELFQTLSQIGRKRHYSAGQILFFEGQEARYLFLLLKGKVRLYKSKEDIHQTTQRTIHTLSAPEFIAEMPFFMQLSYPANAECIEDCEIISISFESFHAHCLQDNQICLLFIASLCQKVRILESHIAQSNQNLQSRLLHYLNTHAHKLATLSQRHIAKELSISPESLSRALKMLKNQGKITTHKGKISLLDS
ncbi:Crp/Fnr family transcriptional regulator [Helicobacter jaachi]|uniref:Crp/Fnr family transcriptional regulator n=1 Tax=Helicobacter jaachi TaxID=1677920 RepID=A0A4U8T7M6_9HELI|nr:Crp/Fnr family transcriptional regulator [Helicobacter jaachi]TLD94667.1 Crp/Fnr family transcriptional regulator [Helicobacter jaachi]